ncbi:MAG: DUF721 domain-containing protein [Pseudomonadota bacterium]|nr:DUF721 domain-containing protein [Pseudomonadota bacterium]
MPPVTPDPLGIAQALQRSAPLVRLRELLHDSERRFAAIRTALPPEMKDHVRPGTVDEDGWSLLAANASVAAKLRQLQPRLEAILREHGWAVADIRIKVAAK